MFAFFAQHFTHQFFKTDVKRGPAFTAATGHGVRDSRWRETKPKKTPIKTGVNRVSLGFLGGPEPHLRTRAGEAAQAQALQGRKAAASGG